MREEGIIMGMVLGRRRSREIRMKHLIQKKRIIADAVKKAILFCQIGKFNHQLKKKKKPNSNLKANLFNQIMTIRQKSNQISKGKSIEQHMDMGLDVDQEVILVHFEEDILMEILSRLPVWSLVRFKCVSSSWKRLISDPYFIRKHLTHAKKDQNSQKFLISLHCRSSNLCSLYCCPLSSVQPFEDVQELAILSRSKPWLCTILCCYDGLSVVEVIDDAIDNIMNQRSTCLLWNPSTRESILLPDPEILPRGTCRFGMGYDLTIGDYKILKIQNSKDSSHSKVLELKSGSWRNISDHPLGISNVMFNTQSLAFVHEAFHWPGRCGNYSMVSRNTYTVISFNISNEVYGEIPLPEQISCIRGSMAFDISVLGGMLCVCSTSGFRMKQTKIWVLKDYGVKEYWNALITIEDPLFSNVQPRYKFADGELLFWCRHVQGRGFALRTISGPFALWPQWGLQNGDAFTESLISPKSLTY